MSVTDEGTVYLIKSLPGIERLYLSDTSITNKTLQCIAHLCSALISLSLVNCSVTYHNGELLQNVFD